MRRSEITVFINNGAGGFNPGASYPVDATDFLAIGDFNSDNHPDLASSSGFNGLTILTNKGNGEFNAAVDFSTGSTSSHLAVADFNNDGKDDALFSQLTGNNIGLALNNFTNPQPCLSINDVTITETDSGTVNATFTVTLSSPTEQIIQVNYFTMATGTINAPPATKGVDFENVSGTLIFPFTETTRTITIPIKGDGIDEFDQFFNVVLTTPVNAVISDGKGLGKITDNDGPPAISINDVTVAEGTANQTSANFTVTLNAPSEKPISVQYALEAGTATAGVDYANFPGTATFLAGTISTNIFVPITQDNTFEPDETFFVNLSNATNATITDSQGQGTITNDDPQPSIVTAALFHVEGGLGTSSNALLEVRLSNPSSQTITVAYSTADITATAGSDYVATSGTLTFNPGETVKFVAVEVLGDNIDEINEQISVTLTNPTNATIGSVPGIIRILDDDGPTVSVSDASVTEGNTGTRNAVFTVTLSAPTVEDVLVNYGTAPGTAFANFDFSSILSNTLVIRAGATSATFNVPVIGDFFIEPDEQFTVHLLFINNATIADGVGTGTIVNDDSNGKLQFSSQTFSATEDAGGVVVTVNRVDGATGTVAVNFATSNGTATAGSDYSETTGTLTLNEGETSKSFFITFTKDNLLEPDETLTVTLSNPTGGATLGTPASATLTITSPQLFLALEETALDPNQVAAFDAMLMLRDPFPVVNPLNLLFGQGTDRNTRVVVFVTNLQLAPNDVASIVRVGLTASDGQVYDLGAEDVRMTPVSNLSQVTFRLPDNLASGVCATKIKARNQESNQGNIRIQ
jgi:large repetitive protein